MGERPISLDPALTDLLFDEADVGFCLLGPDGTVLRANREWLRSTGYTRDQVLGEKFVELFPGTRGVTIEMHALAHAGRRVNVPRHDQHIGGRETWWEGSIDPVPMEGGTGLLITARDVSPATSAALRESEQRYRSLFESMSEGHALHELIVDGSGRAVDYRFLEVNAAFARLTGLDAGKVIGRRVKELIPDIEPDWIERYGRVAATGVSERFEAEAAGLGRWYEVYAYRPAPGRFAVSFADITERKAVQAELARAHERAAFLARFPEENPDPVLRLASDFTIVYANQAARAALAPLSMLEVGRRAPPEISGGAREAVHLGARGHAEVQCADKFYSISFVPVGTEVNVYGHDITTRRRAEEALRDSEHRAMVRAAELDAVLDTVPAAVWIAGDRRGDRIDANRFGSELLRRPRGSNVSVSAARDERPTNFRSAKDGVEIPVDELPMQTAARYGREIRDYDFDLVFEDGTVRHMLGNATPLRDERGEPQGSVGAFIDITGRKNAEDALREASRRKDEFIGMLSHELRNPLAPIRNSIYLLRLAAPGSEQAVRAQSVIERQTDHLTRLVDDLLDVTRIARGKVELRRERVDLRDLVRRTADDFRSTMEDRGITFGMTLPDTKLWADVDPTRITQVIANLLHNAAKFGRRGDEVMLSLRNLEADAEIRVDDTGIGIDPALLPSIFEPFVQGERTLARTEGGLGLGLALVRGIVELHGGKVHATSGGPGKGTTFVVHLPPVPCGVEQDAPTTAAMLEGPRRRVLVVDDNLDAADSLADVVRMLGCDVVVAYDGRAALDAMQANPLDVVLCDLGMPGMDGYDVARALRTSGFGDVQLIAVSGYAQPEDVRKAIEAGFDGHVAKPPTPAEIERLLSK